MTIFNNNSSIMENIDQTESQGILKDSFNRIARKLRISVTDKCNMKCIYCMPNGNIKWNNDSLII